MIITLINKILAHFFLLIFSKLIMNSLNKSKMTSSLMATSGGF